MELQSLLLSLIIIHLGLSIHQKTANLLFENYQYQNIIDLWVSKMMNLISGIIRINNYVNVQEMGGMLTLHQKFLKQYQVRSSSNDFILIDSL